MLSEEEIRPSGQQEVYLVTSYYGSEQVQQAALQTLLQVLALLEALWNKTVH